MRDATACTLMRNSKIYKTKTRHKTIFHALELAQRKILKYEKLKKNTHKRRKPPRYNTSIDLVRLTSYAMLPSINRYFIHFLRPKKTNAEQNKKKNNEIMKSDFGQLCDMLHV